MSAGHVPPVGLPSCAVVVLNWNGRAHLEQLLPSLRDAVDAHPDPVPVVVVDNRSTEPDVAWLAEHYPEVETVVAERNDYLFSLNPIVAGRPEDVVVVLNNDMRVDRGFLAPLLRHFADPQVFAVMANVLDWEGLRRTTGRRQMRLRRGWCYTWWEHDVDEPCHTLYAGGGCSAYRRWQFAELGGFDRAYWPAYLEDVDLSYRAWMRGWKSVYEPSSIIYHREGATLWDRSRETRMQRRLHRNHAIFTARNVGDWGFLALYVAALPARIVLNSRRNPALAAGLLQALPRLPGAIANRFRRGGPRVLTADDIAALIPRPLATTSAGVPIS